MSQKVSQPLLCTCCPVTEEFSLQLCPSVAKPAEQHRCAKHRDGNDIWGLLQARAVCQCVHEGSNRSTLNDVRNLKTLKNNALNYFFYMMLR